MNKKIDLNIEALRGFCALMVVIHHCIEFSPVFNNGYDFRTTVISYKPPGHLMVLVFFMLSGYVIGISSSNPDRFNVWEYIKKRLIRLYPIYIIAILFTVFLFSEKWQSVVGTIFFTQNLFSTVILHNNALWSLNHEVVYYILAIPILIFRLKPAIIISVLLLILCISLKLLQFPAIAVGYVIGFTFWITGFAVSKVKHNQQNSLTVNADKLISAFFILLACEFLDAFDLGRFFSRMNFISSPPVHFLDGLININDVSALPFCLYAIMLASSAKIIGGKLLTLYVYSSCWIHVVYLMINGSFFKVNIFYIPAFFLFLSTVLILSPVKVFKSVSFWIYAGGISYAMYVIHLPLMELIGKINFFSGTTFSFAVRLLVLLFAVIGLAHLLEKIIQPQIKRYFVSKPTDGDIALTHSDKLVV